VLKAIPALEEKDVVRGQFRGYLDEKGVAPDSKVETFAALKLEVNSWRWQGVPFYIRAGKSLPATCTEVVCRLRKPPTIIPADALTSNYFRFRISPDVAVAMGMTVMASGEKMAGEPAEMVGSEHPNAEEMDAYERVLGDAMAGDATLFAREDYVEEAWRIVDPLLRKATPVYPYELHSWGPKEVEQVTPAGGWQNPTIGLNTPVASGRAA
jgi:glucose-6-phosphate 1-dehydrogenase